jgi:hypothetical protein
MVVPSFQEKQLDFAYFTDLCSVIHKKSFQTIIVDFHIIQKSTKECGFNIDKLKSNEWNPAEYNVSGALLRF